MNNSGPPTIEAWPHHPSAQLTLVGGTGHNEQEQVARGNDGGGIKPREVHQMGTVNVNARSRSRVH